ncbi:helix-turn-helix domain-containing protein [Streptomyces sp. NPDC049954]|uniref:helix-turn-helix domain-containing protein n=1 Tax=Streptomyces sp. NPDC049954 TaxID=3155779 RepID=UPI00344574B7
MAGTQLNRLSAPCRGVTHSNRRHTAHFTVIGNHLAQHAELSLIAIGLAVYIQSLPAGADVSIKRLTSRFPESEARIATALRELEHHGYYHRERVRLPSGAIVTRTTSYNQPKGDTAPTRPTVVTRVARLSRTKAVPQQPQPQPLPPEDAYDDRHEPTPPTPAPAATTAPAPHTETGTRTGTGTVTRAGTGAETETETETETGSEADTRAETPPAPLSAVETRAVRILISLRHADPRLLLSATEVTRLTPAVAEWLTREAGPEAIRTALTTNLPEPLHRPAALLTHRLRTGLPPMPPPGPRPTPYETPRPAPRSTTRWTHSCDTCERALPTKASQCRDCARDAPPQAVAPHRPGLA